MQSAETKEFTLDGGSMVVTRLQAASGPATGTWSLKLFDREIKGGFMESRTAIYFKICVYDCNFKMHSLW